MKLLPVAILIFLLSSCNSANKEIHDKNKEICQELPC